MCRNLATNKEYYVFILHVYICQKYERESNTTQNTLGLWEHNIRGIKVSMMTTDLRKLNMKNKSKREKSEWFSVCNSGMHDRTWGNPLSNIKPLGSKRAWWLFLEVVVGARGAQHSECDVWQWGTGVQRTPLAINHNYKGYYKGGAAVTSAFSCDICWQSTWGAVRTTMH